MSPSSNASTGQYSFPSSAERAQLARTCCVRRRVRVADRTAEKREHDERIDS